MEIDKNKMRKYLRENKEFTKVDVFLGCCAGVTFAEICRHAVKKFRISGVPFEKIGFAVIWYVVFAEAGNYFAGRMHEYITMVKYYTFIKGEGD